MAEVNKGGQLRGLKEWGPGTSFGDLVNRWVEKDYGQLRSAINKDFFLFFDFLNLKKLF